MKIENIFIIIVAAVLVISVLTIFSTPNQTRMGGMMYGMFRGYGYGFMLLGWLTYLLIITLIVAAIYWLIKSTNKKS